MGKRTKRLFGSQLAKEIDLLKGKEAHIVLWDDQTLFGYVKDIDSQTITLADKNAFWYNRKKHTHRIQLADIREIILDEVSQW